MVIFGVVSVEVPLDELVQKEAIDALIVVQRLDFKVP